MKDLLSSQEEVTFEVEDPTIHDISFDVTSLKEQGNICHIQGDYELAISIYTEAIKKDPANVILYSNRAASYFMQKEYEKCVKDSLKAIEINPSFLRSYIRCGKGYLMQGYGPKAKIYFEKAQERIKETTNDVNWLSECIEGIHQATYLYDNLHLTRKHLDSNTPELSSYYIDSCLEICPGARDPNLLKIECNLALNSPQKVIELFKTLLPNILKKEVSSLRLVDLQPKLWRMPEKEFFIDVKLILFYVKSLMMMGEFTRSSQICKLIPSGLKHSKIAEITNQKIQLMLSYKDKANIFYKQCDYLKAIRYYTEAKNIADPCCTDFIATIHCNRSAAYIALGRYDEAIEDCKDALKLKPNMEKALARKAKAEGYNKNYLESVNTWTELTKSFPGNSEYLEELQRAYVHLSTSSPYLRRAKEKMNEEKYSNFKKEFKFPKKEKQADYEIPKNQKRYSTPRPERKDLFKLLGVTRASSVQEIKKKYHALALQFHPDKNPDPNIEEKFKEMTMAYQVLTDEEKRERYFTTGCY